MADFESEFLSPKAVDAISQLSESTRARREKAGRFPRRVKLSARKIGYRKTQIKAWQADPEGWTDERNSVA
jgi:predicted DNA-binding transcriptional regulator AlpA